MNHALSIVGKTAILTIPDKDIDEVVVNGKMMKERHPGNWHYSDGKPAIIGQSFGVICDQCGKKSEYCTNFCPECGADMGGNGK